MPDSRLAKEFEKMDARQLQHLLGLMCNGKTFSLRVPGARAKINFNAENVSITTQGIHEDNPDSYNFKDCENYKEGDDNKDDIAKDTPKESKSKIGELVKSSEGTCPDYSPNIFPCARCCLYFDINSSFYDCLWHPGKLMTNIMDAIWANHDVEKYGSIEDLVHHPGFEDRWVWSCCGELGSGDGCKGTRHMVPKEYGGLEDSSRDSSESEDFEDTPRDSSTE